MSPGEVLCNLQAQVLAGNVLYIETNGVGCYADPRHRPTRAGKMMGRKSTPQSKTGDLVGKVVIAVREIVERKKEQVKNKKSSLVSHHLSPQFSPLIGNKLCSPPTLSPNGNNNRNVMATMGDILLHVQQSSCIVADEMEEAEGITPSLLKAAVKRAVMRGFLNESGKYYSIDNSKEFHTKGRKRQHPRDSKVPHDTSHLLIEDGGSSDSSLTDNSYLSSSLTALTSPSLLTSPLPHRPSTNLAVTPAKSSRKSVSKADRNKTLSTPSKHSKSQNSPKKSNLSSMKKEKSSTEPRVSFYSLIQIFFI